MDSRRQSMTVQHNAAIAAHLQAQQHQVYAQAQQQAAAVAAAQQQRNSSFVWHQHAAAANNATNAQIQNGFPNFMPSMLAIQSSMNQMSMVATAKLAPFKNKHASNSSLTVRTSVPRLNVAGGVYTVAQWARKCVEDNLDFVTKISRTDDPQANLVMLAYGDGCQTIVFFDGAMNKLPDDLSKIKKIHVGISTAFINDKRTGSEMAESGVLQPTDSLWDHLRYEQVNPSKDKKEKSMFIHTSMKVYGESDVGRRRVLQIKTKAPKSPFVAESYMRNVMFEQEMLTKWKGEVPGVVPALPEFPITAAGVPTAPVPTILPAPNTTEEVEEINEYLITFNPKELLLLEKAFDNALTSRDLKSKAEKWTDEDKKKCQMTIRRAENEFKYVFPRKPNRKKLETDENNTSNTPKETVTNKVTPTSGKKPVPKSLPKKDDTKKGKQTKDHPKKAKPSTAGKKNTGSTPKNFSTKPMKPVTKSKTDDDPVDSDDEPIVKLKTPSKKATPSKKSKVKASGQKKNQAKKEITPLKETSKKANPTTKTSGQDKAKVVKKSDSKKRGRDKSVERSPKKARSSSKSRSTRSKR